MSAVAVEAHVASPSSTKDRILKPPSAVHPTDPEAKGHASRAAFKCSASASHVTEVKKVVPYRSVQVNSAPYSVMVGVGVCDVVTVVVVVSDVVPLVV